MPIEYSISMKGRELRRKTAKEIRQRSFLLGLIRSWSGEDGHLTEVDTYDWIIFLSMCDGGGAYNRYTGIYIPLLKEKGKREDANRLLV